MIGRCLVKGSGGDGGRQTEMRKKLFRNREALAEKLAA